MEDKDIRFDPVRNAVIHQPKNQYVITEMWAWVSVDPVDGNEGVVAQSWPHPNGTVLMPFVGADRERIQSLLPEVRRMRAISKNPIRLIKFSTREIIEEI